MEMENMKNMVILKDLPSNIAEEAIVILKPNIKLRRLDLAETKKENKETKTKDDTNTKKYIINEAEMIVNNYLSRIEIQKKNNLKINKKMEIKYKRAKAISIVLGVLLLVSFLI